MLHYWGRSLCKRMGVGRLLEVSSSQFTNVKSLSHTSRHYTLKWCYNIQFSSVQLLSHVRVFATPWICSTPGLPVHHEPPEFTQTHVHRVGDAIQPSHSLSSPSPILSLSQRQGLFQVFSGYSGNQSFSFSISPSSAYSGLISFTMDWFDLLVVQGTLKSSPAPQLESINSSVLSLFYELLTNMQMVN